MTDSEHGIVADEENLGARVVDDVLDLLAVELMQDRYSYRPIGEGPQETDGPVGGVTAADGNLVALLDTAVF